MSRLKQEEVIATAPPNGPYFVGVGGGGSDLSAHPLFVRSCNLLWLCGLLQRLDGGSKSGSVTSRSVLLLLSGLSLDSSRGQIAVQRWGVRGGWG